MSEENIRSASLENSSGEVSEKNAGFGDVAEEVLKSEQSYVKNDDGLGDAREETLKEEDELEDVEDEEEEKKMSLERQASGEEMEEGDDEEEFEERPAPEINEGEEEEIGVEGEDEGEEEEEGEGEEEGEWEEEGREQVEKLQPSSASALIVLSILEEILETVFVAVGIEPGEESEGEEGESEEEEEFEAEHPPVQAISVMTIKSEESRAASEVSEGRELLPREEDEQLRKDTEEQARREEFDRNVRLFNQYMRMKGELKRKNAYLTRKMYEFYQERKMEHLFKEVAPGNQEMEARYVRALSRYDELKNSADIEEGKANVLIELLSTRYEELSRVKEEELAALEAAEKEVGEDLPFNYCSKRLQDKALDKLIKNQLAKCAEVDDFRVKYFVLRDTVNAQESELKALDDIGGECTMKEYDQLRLHNQGCIEKLEERVAELEKLRTKALSSMQIFTEVREAAHAMSEDIETERRALTDAERDLDQTRERLGTEKKRRDLNRFDTIRLQRETGLAFRPSLLRDYRRSKLERDALQDELEHLHQKSLLQKQSLAKMRGSIKSLHSK